MSAAALDDTTRGLVGSMMKLQLERDQYREALQDILLGANMMLQPACNLSGAMLGYVREVKRVAEENLK